MEMAALLEIQQAESGRTFAAAVMIGIRMALFHRGDQLAKTMEPRCCIRRVWHCNQH
jgi:hypothetical protein